MNIDNCRAQILVNRAQLTELYECLAAYKAAKRAADAHDNLDLEYVYHNDLKEIKRDIARLVVLQKALKADVSMQVKQSRMLKNLCANLFKVSNAKLDAMERAGECYE